MIIVFLPFWFRLAQCFRRFKDTNDKKNLVNAGKYFSVMRNEATFNVFLGLSILSTLYSFAWDLYIDWGFFQTAGSLAALKKRDIRGFLR